MKRENCIEVKYVNNLSVAYLTRFFGSVGPVIKVEKEEVSKYVTIQFAHKNSVERAFRFNGRTLDERPIKIRKCRSPSPDNPPPKIQQFMSFTFETNTQPSLILDDLWNLIQNEIKPHHFSENQHILLSMLIWCLVDLLIGSAKHIMKYKVNMRSKYLKFELEKLIIDRITRKNANVVTISEGSKTAVLEMKNALALAWFTVPFPNIQQEQSKVEAASLMTKCIATIKNFLSLRLSELVFVLNATSLISNLQETRAEDILNLKSQVTSTQEDNFIGVVQNLGTKNIFYDLQLYELPNTSIYLKQNKILRTFECNMRLKGCSGQQLHDASWCNFYSGQLIKKVFAKHGEFYLIENKQKIENVVLGQQALIFQNGQFSLQNVEAQLKLFKEIEEFKGIVFYIAKELTLQKFHQFKKIYEDDVLKIEEEVEHIETIEKGQKSPQKYQQQPQTEEIVTDIILIQIKSQNVSAFNNLKLTHYLQSYLQESVLGKGLIIASKEMAIKLASNIIERQKQNRLFEFGDKRYEQYIGEELWRVYNRQGQRKTKNILAKYSMQTK